MVAATLNYSRISAQKMRLVVDQIRGKTVADSLSLLMFSPKKAAGLVLKLLKSAVANAENNFGLDVDALRVQKIFVDQAPSFKRSSPRAKGRGNRIVKRCSHVTVVVGV